MLFPVVEVTRSLSNLIKYTFVNFDKEDSYVIDYEKKEKPVEEPELQMTQVPDPEGFEAGVPVKNFDQVWEEKQEEAREQARVVLEEADKEAAQILEQARQEADDVRQQALIRDLKKAKLRESAGDKVRLRMKKMRSCRKKTISGNSMKILWHRWNRSLRMCYVRCFRN